METLLIPPERWDTLTPGDVTLYAQETPVGATCEAQACIGVDNAGSFKIHFSHYDGMDTEQSAVFNVEI